MPNYKAKGDGKPLCAAAGNTRTRFFFASVGDKQLTITFRQYFRKKIKKSDKALPFFSIAATQLQTLSIKVGKLIFILLAFAFAASTAYADVYKCVVNGKIVYSDARCAYKPDTIKIDPNQNVVQGERSVANDSRPNVTARSNDPKCAELLDRLHHVQTTGDLNKISQEYEFRCMSSGDREVSVQNRNSRELQRKLDDIQSTQQQILNRQRGIGY